MSAAEFPTSANNAGVPFVYPGEILAAVIVLPLLGVAVISLRFWGRILSKQGLGADDWTILAALPFTMAMAIMVIWGVAKHAVGYPSVPYPIHKSSLELEALTETTRVQTEVFIVYWATWLLMIPANGLIKISALLFYRRLFVVNKWTSVDIVTRVMMVICVLWTIGFFFAQLFGCGTAFTKPWGSLEEVASCNTNVRLNALMVSDLLTDILVWIIPFPVVWSLNMSLTKKFNATAILLLATISLVAAAIRLEVEISIANSPYSSHVDADQVLTINIYWSNIESSLALIASCLPTLTVHVLRQLVKSTVTGYRYLLSIQPFSKVAITDHLSADRNNSVSYDGSIPQKSFKYEQSTNQSKIEEKSHSPNSSELQED